MGTEVELITNCLLSHLSIALIVGALGSVGTSWAKSVFKTDNRWVNIAVTFIIIAIFTYIVVIVYADMPNEDALIIFFYANLGAKALYEAVNGVIKDFGTPQAYKLDGTVIEQTGGK